MKKLAIKYYLSSIKSIVYGINNWYMIPLLGLTHPLKFNVKNNGSFFADNFMDIWTLKEVLIDDCYKIKKMKRVDTIMDIGAAIGDFSILSSLKANHVISCEFDNNRLSLLKRNIQLANRKNITIIPKKIIILDSIIPSEVRSCDLLKIDCEGSEYPILLNSRIETLKSVKKIVGELHFFNKEMKDDFIRLKRRLKVAGFALTTWNNPVHDSICYFSATR